LIKAHNPNNLPTIDYRDLIELQPNSFKDLSEKNFDKLTNSFKIHGFITPYFVWKDKDKHYILDGHQRTRVLSRLEPNGLEVPYIEVEAKSKKEAAEKLLAIDSRYGKRTSEGEQEFIDIFEITDGYLEEVAVLEFEYDHEEDGNSLGKSEKALKLSDRFIIPPFSVLDTRQGIWQDRKRYWLSLGIKSEIGRNGEGQNNTRYRDASIWKEGNAYDGGSISVFDPVLCELSYLWFNIPNGRILDPFAGGSVRGIVAAKLGFTYVGNDLSLKQVEANRINAKDVLRDAELYPTWTTGDSNNIINIVGDYTADMIFSCPPYADLEVYSDDISDISTMPYDEFLIAYRQIIKNSCSTLNNDRFAVFVVGDVRDKNGFYRNFVSDTISAFLYSGLMLYNEIILLNPSGNLHMRVSNYMKSRKVGKTHQNVLVFYKGDPKNIKKNYPELDLEYMREGVEIDANTESNIGTITTLKAT
jgi:hypothetical protein